MSIYELIEEAEDSCEFRDHDMKPFIQSEDHTYASSECNLCGAVVAVRTNPLPNEIDIGGEAVAVHCRPKLDVVSLSKDQLPTLNEWDD